MAATATTTSAPASSAGGNAKAPALLPFRGGTQGVIQQDGYSQTVTLGASAQPLPNYNPSANNLLRCIWVQVVATTSDNEESVVYNGDMPLGIFSSISLNDQNTKPIIGPFSSYVLGMVNKYGGYDANGDPRASAVYVASTSGGSGGSFTETFRVPCEAVVRNGVGSLVNQNQSSQFQLAMTVTTESLVYETEPTNAPSVTVTCFESGYWNSGNAQYASQPKAAGSTQYWTQGTYNGLNGSQQIQLQQGLGFSIRNIIELNYYDGARSGEAFPTSVQYLYKGSTLLNVNQTLWQDQMSRNYGLRDTSLDVANGLDTGVFVLPFDQDFTFIPGNESGLGYLVTDQGDSFQILGTWNDSSTMYHAVNYFSPFTTPQSLQSTN